MTPTSIAGLLLSAALASFAVPVLLPPDQDPQEQDLATRKRRRLKDNAADFWIYDDLKQGETKAKATGKPLLVSFRCVP